MSYRRKDTLEIRTLLTHLRATPSDRRVTQQTGIHRKTVRKYRIWARTHNLLAGSLPQNDALHQMLDETLPVMAAPQSTSCVEPYREMVLDLRAKHVEIGAIFQRLKERGFGGSYSAVYRFVRAVEPRLPDVTVRVETPPAEEAQVDFGDAGMLFDPETGRYRRASLFVMVLSFSRHLYVEFVFDQTETTWAALHMRAFSFFGGVPQRVVLDNLKAGVVKASVTDPVLNRTYAALAEHYGFLVAPCRPATPQHKGKTESSVHFVKRNFLGGRDKTPLPQTNKDALAWCSQVGQRIHGTTRKKPIDQFVQVEQPLLQALPAAAYDPAVYKQVKLHRDCYVTFEQSYYSAPFRLVGQLLWIRAGISTVHILDDKHAVLATHSRAQEPGERLTNPDHLPVYKLPGLLRSRQAAKEQATTIGDATLALVEELLAEPVIDRTATVGRLLALAATYSPARLEASCRRAQCFEDRQYATVKRILQEGLDLQPVPSVPSAPMAGTYARTAAELFGEAAGGAAWM